MKISTFCKAGKLPCPCEIFPPKPHVPLEQIEQVVAGIAATHPDFFSVTYGAGGSTSKRTVEIAADIQDTYHIPRPGPLNLRSGVPQPDRRYESPLSTSGASRTSWPCGATCRRMNPEPCLPISSMPTSSLKRSKNRGISALGRHAIPKAMWNAAIRKRILTISSKRWKAAATF